jgi:hypothetical protein
MVTDHRDSLFQLGEIPPFLVAHKRRAWDIQMCQAGYLPLRLLSPSQCSRSARAIGTPRSRRSHNGMREVSFPRLKRDTSRKCPLPGKQCP